jgi:hypothetical protein
MIIPEKRTKGSNDLSRQVIEGEHFYGHPDHAEVNQEAAKRDRGKRGKLYKVMPVTVMEIEIFVQDITSHNSATVRDRGCRNIPDAEICTKNIQQADIN